MSRILSVPWTRSRFVLSPRFFLADVSDLTSVEVSFPYDEFVANKVMIDNERSMKQIRTIVYKKRKRRRMIQSEQRRILTSNHAL
jgi:hypothetical protein